MTLRRSRLSRTLPGVYDIPVIGGLAHRVSRPLNWLRPNGSNLRQMLDLVSDARHEGAEYIEFMLHSSEFMPGGSPSFPDKRSIDELFEHIEILFEAISVTYSGATLFEYYEEVKGRSWAGIAD